MIQLTEPAVLTSDEAANHLRVSAEAIEKLAITGTIPGRRIDGQWRFLKSALDHWLAVQDQRTVFLAQAGALADDPTLADLRARSTPRVGDRKHPEPASLE